MIDLRRADYERWLRDQPRERTFQARSAGCDPLAIFLREAHGLPGVGVFAEAWKPRPKGRAYPLPPWARDVVRVHDAAAGYFTAATALAFVRGNP